MMIMIHKLWKACREGFPLRERNTLTDDDDDSQVVESV